MANPNQLSLSDHKQATKSLTKALLDKVAYLESLKKLFKTKMIVWYTS